MAILSIFQDVYNHIYNYVFTKNVHKKPNLGEDLRLVMQSSEFEKQLRSSSPFLITGLIAWPSYWLYRGLEWHSVRDVETLPSYIRKTFYRAKILEFCILLTGILMTIRSSHKALTRQLEVKEMVQKK
ncbi:uncharacterized protein LOC119606767 [Lucilia sericata]|uniref:uncharacterized protein LOC119606767 n=1 Tax=Lucilia sericata TaxID=13632 RepID=UPI0018A8255E|nr:uncharacterized protein LOC119606767 [Lucilia sericata]